MPYVRVDLALEPGPERRRRLLVELAELFAEVTESPVERVRTQVAVLGDDGFAVGAEPIDDAAGESPFVTIALLAGRPAVQHRALIEGVTALVAEVLAVPLARVRVWIHEVPPELWGIGGVPAAEQRRGEITARRT